MSTMTTMILRMTIMTMVSCVVVNGATVDDSELSDTEKLMKALGDVTEMFSSVDKFFESLGLANMPTAQRYGIMFGCLVFFLTVTAVLTLLVLGGSFTRIAEQSESGTATVPYAHTARVQRALLLERLLESREYLKSKYENSTGTERDNNETSSATSGFTPLTHMLSNEVPPTDNFIDEDEKKDEHSPKKMQKNQESSPYVQNYVAGYRKCQDKPGGEILSGRPEARFEAYARAYAGCGDKTMLNYRRSYARVYEAISCQNHKTDDKYSALFKERPQDIVGKKVRLEPLEADRHIEELYMITSGEPTMDEHSYDPNEVWSFHEAGPFKSEDAMKSSFVFPKKPTEAGFAIINNITDKLIGIVRLANDDPHNLRIQLEPPIVPPYKQQSAEQMEAGFLIIDRLFAYGYRRIQFLCDSQDALNRKVASALGFSLEGQLYKHMIIKESSRDSNVYALVNSDWDKGARFALFKNLYGESAAKMDNLNRKKDEEIDVQNKWLAEQKAKEQEKGIASKEVVSQGAKKNN